MSPSNTLPLLAATVAVTLAAAVGGGVVVALEVATAAPAAAAPARLLPAPEATGGEVTLEPAAVRAPDGRAELDVVLGPRAPGDVVVELGVTAAAVTPDGVVTPGAPAEGARISTGARVQPGERLRVVVTTTGEAPVVVTADVRAADPRDGTDTSDADASDASDVDPVQLAAVVLPGALGPPPSATIEVAEGVLRATITASAPTLVTAELAGARRTTYPDRLVLPSQPLVVEGAPARWPSPSVLVVTDEGGRTVTADTGRAPLVAIATSLLVAAAVTAGLLAQRRRRHSPADAS